MRGKMLLELYQRKPRDRALLKRTQEFSEVEGLLDFAVLGAIRRIIPVLPLTRKLSEFWCWRGMGISAARQGLEAVQSGEMLPAGEAGVCCGVKEQWGDDSTIIKHA